MAQSLTLKFKGLYTNTNELSSVPEGALTEAENIDIMSESLAQPRRGFDKVTGAYSDESYRADKIFSYQSKILSHYGTQGSASILAYLNSGTWTTIGSYSAPSGTKMRAIQANQNFYFTTSDGVKKIDAYNGTPTSAGAPKALDAQASVSSSATTWLTNAYRTAYRIVWGYRDANNNLILGAPSQRISFKNTSGSTKSVDLAITIPASITTSWFYQVYRAAMVDNTSTDTEPSDEMGLVYEDNPTTGSFSSTSFTFLDADVNTGTEVISVSGHTFVDGDMVVFSTTGTLPAGLTAGTTYYVVSAVASTSFKVSATYGGAAVNITSAAGGGTHTVKGAQVLTFTDIVDDPLRGATIYTASSQEGLANGNERPPYCDDIAVFRDCAFYVNTSTVHRYYLTILAVSGASGIANNDTITIGGITYTGKTAGEDVSQNYFKVETGGSASQDIRDTAESLVRVINRSSTSTVYAYYISGVDDLPGKILLEKRTSGASFAVTASNGGAFNPQLPTAGTTQSSTNDDYPNGIYWSKPSQPEAVPLVNFATAGSKSKAIKRAIPLKDSLLLMTEGGIYRVSGYYPSFNIDLLDSSAVIIGDETPAILNNTVFMLSTQGIVAVGDSVSVISLPIEDGLRERIAQNQTDIESLAFGVGYEAERRYYLFLPDATGDDWTTTSYVYNSFTRTFTRHALQATSGYVTDDGDFYLGNALDETLLIERKTYSYTDHADYGFTTSISAITDDVLTISASVDQIEVGDVIWQSSTLYANVTEVDVLAGTVTVTSDPGFSVAAVTVLKSIAVSLKWAPITMGNPAALKQFSMATVIMKNDFLGTAYLTFDNDINIGEETVELTGSRAGLWGYSWGYSWGGEIARRPAPQWIPRGKQVCSQLIVGFTHNYGYSLWKMEGISISGELGDDRVSR